MKKLFPICFALCFVIQISAQIPVKTLVQISRAEDELRFDKTLEDLMKSTDAKVRARAALAAGRIGKDAAAASLTELLEKDSDATVRAAAAFALGEIESVAGADAILRVLQNTNEAAEVRARGVEAAGKIAAANQKNEKSKQIGAAILNALEFENALAFAKQNRSIILLGITAILRAKPEGGDALAAKFLTNTDARIRADAANTLSRLRSKIADEKLRAMLVSDSDAIARANAARALGAAESAGAFDILLGAAFTDGDVRVRVSAIRSLGALKDTRAAEQLLARGETFLAVYKNRKFANPAEKNELLEIASSLGRILPKSDDARAVKFLENLRYADDYQSPETEIAFAQISPAAYLKTPPRSKKTDANFWKQLSSAAQGMAEFSKLADKSQPLNSSEQPEKILLTFLAAADSPKTKADTARAIPDILSAYAAFKSNDLIKILREYLNHQDVIVRATAAGLLAELPATKENIAALKTAFDKSLLTDKQLNDAQLAILDALFKLDKKESVGTLLIALNAQDYLVRKRAFELLETKDLEKDFPGLQASVENARAKKEDQVLPYAPAFGTKLGQILNSQADYVRAVSRKNARAILTTEKGTFTIEFSPADAPLTVDNFIKLAKANYFNGLTIHRVVPNFVVQDGDPRGDGNGGPGWEIRDEINMQPYQRGTVGMALSGKNTGGSQWFVCHSPQPHLDGGYTVFGRVSEADMKVVDNLARGDKILSVKIVEGK